MVITVALFLSFSPTLSKHFMQVRDVKPSPQEGKQLKAVVHAGGGWVIPPTDHNLYIPTQYPIILVFPSSN